MTKQELIGKIHLTTGIEKAEVSAIVESFCVTVKQAMADGNNIYVRGFGTFQVKKRAKKIARNISQNTPLVIPPRHIPSFKPSREFVAKMKQKYKGD